MEKTGIFRGIDRLGRIVIPMEIRKTLDIKEGDDLEISLIGDAIRLQKKVNSCLLCGSEWSLVEVEGKYFCTECAAKIGKMVSPTV